MTPSVDSSPQNVEQLYDSYAISYDELTVNADYQGPKWIQEQLSKREKPVEKFLDLACASGNLGTIIHAKYPEASLCGIDISEGMLQQCEKREIYSNLYKHDLSLGLPVEIDDKQFDMIFGMGCLEFIDNHRALFQEIHSLLAEGGQFLFTLAASGSKLPHQFLGCNYYDHEDDFCFLLLEAGFQELEITRQLGYVQTSDGVPQDYFYICASR